jgi:hypothetical protein
MRWWLVGRRGRQKFRAAREEPRRSAR